MSLEGACVRNERPILLKDEIRTVVAIVTGDTNRRRGWRRIVSRLWHFHVFRARPVAGLTAYIGELWRRLDIEEPLFLKTHTVTANARRIKDPLLGFKCRECL